MSMPASILPLTDITTTIGRNQGTLSVHFSISEFPDVFVTFVFRIWSENVSPLTVGFAVLVSTNVTTSTCIGECCVTISPSRYVTVIRTRWKCKTLSRTSQKNGKGQAECDGQMSHMGIVTENVGEREV